MGAPTVHFEYLGFADYVLLTLNLLILVFSKQIVNSFGSGDRNNKSAKLYALRMINLILFALFITAFFIEGLSKQISLTGVTFLVAFLVSHFIHIFITKKFGRDKEIDGTTYHIETYQSEVFSLLVSLVASITALLIVINIWGMKDWLEATSVLGILAILIFSTKDVWVPDNISGLMLLYANDIEPGTLVKVEEQDLLGIVIEISLTRTMFRDLKTRHVIIMPNTVLRKSKIEVLSKGPSAGLLQFIHFNIAYGTESAKVEQMLTEIWQKACENTNAINVEKDPDITITETGDHAVTWRLGYRLKNLYQMLEVECLVKKIAYQVSQEHQIGLETPLTHQVQVSKSE